MISGFGKYIPYMVPGTSLDIVNYNAMLVIPYATGMKADFSDLRFTDSDKSTPLAQYRESYTSGVTSTWWIKIPNKPAAGKTIYLFFQNSLATLLSSGDDTFLLWDEGASGDMSKWIVGYPTQTLKIGGYIRVLGDLFNSPYYGTITSKASFGTKTGARFRFMQKGGPTTWASGWAFGYYSVEPGHFHSVNQYVPRHYYDCMKDGEVMDDLGADVMYTWDIQRINDTHVLYIKNGVQDHDAFYSGHICNPLMVVTASAVGGTYPAPQFPVFLLFEYIFVYTLQDEGLQTLVPGDVITVSGETSLLMADELAIRLEDPAGDVFSMATKLDLLNKAQVELMDVIDGNYLTELERTETGKTLTAGTLPLSDLNGGKGVFGGAEGIKMIVVRIGGVGGGIRATLVDKEDIKEFENPWFAPTDTRPAYYIDNSKIYVLVKTHLNTTIDVSFIAIPGLMTLETDPDLSPMLCGLIITLAEATGWATEGKQDRKETARQHAFKQINFLNDRMFADPDRFEPILFEYGRPKPASSVLKKINKYPYPNIYTKNKERAFR